MQQRSQQTAVSLSERYKDVTTIAQAFKLQEPPLAKLQGDVKGSVKMHLAALARFLNLRATLTEEHIEFIAERIITDQYYKWLKPADLKIFFDRIKMGRYGDFYGNLNSISFFQSLDKYMIERNGEIEKVNVREAEVMRDDLKKSNVLGYFVNKDGKIEFTEQKKKQIEEEKKKSEEIAMETKRKQDVAADNSNMSDDDKKKVKEIMEEWDVPYNEALRLFNVEKNNIRKD